ncbi:MAG TPA: hypothetical protein VGB23_04185, partial [Nitrospirota bacterium]
MGAGGTGGWAAFGSGAGWAAGTDGLGGGGAAGFMAWGRGVGAGTVRGAEGLSIIAPPRSIICSGSGSEK